METYNMTDVDERFMINPVELSDPFYKNKIIRMSVSMDVMGSMVGAYGYIIFRAGSTEGRQEFEGRTFDEVVIKIKDFLNRMR